MGFHTYICHYIITYNHILSPKLFIYICNIIYIKLVKNLIMSYIYVLYTCLFEYKEL